MAMHGSLASFSVAHWPKGQLDAAGKHAEHLLQLLCLVAMELPISVGERDLRDRKVDVLRSLRALSPEEAVNCTCRDARAAAKSADKLSLPMPKSTESRRNTRRPSPKCTSSWTTRAGPARPSGPARRCVAYTIDDGFAQRSHR
jgi:hypothetical protein